MEITKKIYSEISAGELFDKISILEIKKNKIKEKSKRNIVLKELGSLQEAVNENIEKSKSLTKLYKKLKSVNLIFNTRSLIVSKINCSCKFCKFIFKISFSFAISNIVFNFP